MLAQREWGLWQKQDDGNTKLIAYGSRYLNETEKKHSVNSNYWRWYGD